MAGLKEQGRNAHARFRAGTIEPSHTFLNLDHRIYHGLEHGEFHLHFAPIVDIRTGSLFAMEVLTRWAHPQLGTLTPPRYLASPTSAVALRIEEKMLFVACSHIMALPQTGASVPRMSMNVSSRTALGAGFPMLLHDIFAQTGFPAARLQLEIDQRELIEIGDQGFRALRAVTDLGVRIAVERFGVGSSSLKRLKGLPVSMLKLDRVFACDASSPKNQSVLAGAIIASAHGAGLNVIADGVETQAQLDFLRAEGCDAVQGALVGRPLPPLEAMAFLETFDADRFAMIPP
jgi:EAL domain-containing protein (putative c-di-GMP-specific phosphodiesterase class I)